MPSMKKRSFYMFLIIILIYTFGKLIMIGSSRSSMEFKRLEELNKEHQMSTSEKQKRTTHPIDTKETQSSSKVVSTVEKRSLVTQATALNRSNPFMNVNLVLTPSKKKFCRSESTLVIAFVKSAVPYKQRRQLIRKLWGNVSYYPQTQLEVVFILGYADDPNVQTEIEAESDLYGDIVQMNVLDTYWNLPYKIMAALIWVEENCLRPPWVLEVDDDVLVNPFELKIFLESELKINSNPLVIKGHVPKKHSVNRRGKWAITHKEYPGSLYPVFVTGCAYIIGRKSVPKLIEFAKKTPFLRLDDVFYTGLVAEKANITRKDISSKYYIKFGSGIKYNKLTLFYVEMPVNFKHWEGPWKSIVYHSDPKHNKYI